MKTILAVSVFASLSLPVMSVAASVYEMPAVLVTAERTEAEIRKEPQSAEIVTSEDIKRSGAYDMRSALFVRFKSERGAVTSGKKCGNGRPSGDAPRYEYESHTGSGGWETYG